MPRAIIAPSILASDFGCLTAECKRMINGGAEWLHMGTTPRFLNVSFSFHRAQMLWTGESNSIVSYAVLLIRTNKMTAILYLTSLSVSIVSAVLYLNIDIALYRPTCSRIRFKECSRNIHGLPYDGISARKSEELLSSTTWLTVISG
jgi:hypothetical protein